MKLYIFLFALFFIAGCRDTRKTGGETDTLKSPVVYVDRLDSSLMENSGIIYWNKSIWTFNDSGGKNELYRVDPASGKILSVVKISNATNVDWEDIAQDDKYIYVAEFGNNFGDRKDLQVLKVAKKQISNSAEQLVTAEKIYFQYDNQVNFKNEFKGHRFDCEALMVYKDKMYMFSKDWLLNKALLYELSVEPGNYTITPIDSFNVDGLITGADILKNGKYALVGYKDFKSFIWLFEMTPNNYFSSPKQIKLDMLKNAQTEGICFSPEGDLLFSCERTLNYNEQIWKIPAKQLK